MEVLNPLIEQFIVSSFVVRQADNLPPFMVEEATNRLLSMGMDIECITNIPKDQFSLLVSSLLGINELGDF